MKAWRLHAYGDLRFDEVPLPTPGPGWVLVKVKVVQAAIADLGHMQGMPHPREPRMTKMMSEGKPVQLGHEFCGEVVDIGQGVATLDANFLKKLPAVPRRLGILSQTTQIPDNFNTFVKGVLDIALVKDSEIRIIDTICHDIRERQAAAILLAGRSDLVLVIGGHTSANTRHLVELCSKVTETHLVETAGEIEPSWFPGQRRVGVTSGASTDDKTIDEVILRLKDLS